MLIEALNDSMNTASLLEQENKQLQEIENRLRYVACSTLLLLCCFDSLIFIIVIIRRALVVQQRA